MKTQPASSTYNGNKYRVNLNYLWRGTQQKLHLLKVVSFLRVDLHQLWVDGADFGGLFELQRMYFIACLELEKLLLRLSLVENP